MGLSIIDFSGAEDLERQRALASELDQALQAHGFVALVQPPLPEALQAQAFAAARAFFAEPTATKARFAYGSAADNFGYQGPGVEALDPAQPGDLKETFTMRAPASVAESRWPSPAFRLVSEQLYGACVITAQQLLRVFALALEQPPEFFAELHTGINITLRLLRYPGGQPPGLPALGAGAHTDYGSLTLLIQEGVPGLQLKQADGSWWDCVPQAGHVVVNTGDLMAHWSNGRYPSTEHRVLPTTGPEDRYSIAFFMDPDPEVLVRCLPATTRDRPPAYADITAGAHIQRKIQATHHR